MFNIKGCAVTGFALCSIAIVAAASAAAQSGHPHEAVPRADVALDYSYLRANATPGQCGCFNLNGGGAELALRLYRNFSVVADITGDHAGTTSVPGQSLSLVSYTAGPRFSYPLHFSQRTSVTPFAQGLVGVVHGFDAPFPNGSGTLADSANALAVLLGGGVDIKISRRFSLRPAELDFELNHLPNNANNSQHLLRISTGVVFHIR